MNATKTYLVELSEDWADREYPWLVLDEDGEVLDRFETESEAFDYRQELETEDCKEADEEEADRLREQIADAMQYMTLAEIKTVAEAVLKARGI